MDIVEINGIRTATLKGREIGTKIVYRNGAVGMLYENDGADDWPWLSRFGYHSDGGHAVTRNRDFDIIGVIGEGAGIIIPTPALFG